MAAAKKKKQEPTSETAIAVTTKGGELVTYDYGEDAGAGWENTTSDDFAIPFLNQLQALSAQVQEGETTFVEGAKVGMFANSVTNTLYKDVIFVPCYTQHVYVEWVPRDAGGGFVGVHELDSDVVKMAKAEAKDRNLKNGENDLIETYYVYALTLDEAGAADAKEMVVMSFSKTKIKRYKAIMTRLRTLKGSSKIPLFANQITMSVTHEKNASGDPYKNAELNPAVDGDVAASLLPADSPLLEVAKGFLDSVASGERKADHSTATSEGRAKETDEVF